MLRRALLVLDVLLVVAVGALAVQLHRASTAPPVTLPAGSVATTSAAAPAAEPAPAPARPPASAFMVVAERNLFNSNRTETPPEPPKAAAKAAPATPPPPKPRLYGIVVMPDGQARAYLEDVQRRKVFAYSVGDSIAESRVETIAADRVVLRRGGETYEVLLRDPAKPKPPAPPQAANPFAAAAAAATGAPVSPEGAAGPLRPTARPGTVPTLPFGATPGGVPGALPFAPGASPFGQGTMAPSGPPAASPFAPRRRTTGVPGAAADPTRSGGQDAGTPSGEDD